MNKANIVRSSEFHADVGDVIHYILIVDSGATPTINVVSLGTTSNEEEVPDAVVALDASDITSSSFTANWNFIENGQSYYLDVATDSAFTAFVAGYNNLSVGAVNERSVVGLTDGYIYYYRVRASNDYGTGSSSNTITTTTEMELVVDGDGNVYTYITIGTQQWLVENLITTKYIDGTAIPNLIIDANWQAEDGTVGHDGAYCWYDNNEATYGEYGCLYNWYAVNNAHGIAPTGWHIPTQADITTLKTSIGGAAIGGGKLKEIGLTHWLTPNTGATDEYGFAALASGVRFYTATFGEITSRNWLWTSTQSDALNAYHFYMMYNSGAITGATTTAGKRYGMTIRCMRDL